MENINAAIENREPFIIGLSNAELISTKALDEFRDEAKGRAISQDPFGEIYTTYNLIEPPQDLQYLSNLRDANTFHGKCLRIKVGDTVGQGYDFVSEEGKGNEQDKENLKEFLKTRCVDGEQIIGADELLRRWWNDVKSNGNGALELIYPGYDQSLPLGKIGYIPSFTVRVHKSKLIYCQMVGTKRIWFKAPGVVEDCDWQTGALYPPGTLPVERLATVLLHTKEHTTQSSYYGLPDFMATIGAIYSQLSIRNYNINFFTSYGIPAYAVYVTGNVNFGDKDETTGEYAITTMIKNKLKEIVANPHAPLILTIPSIDPEGKVEVKFVPLDVRIKDGQFQVLTQWDRDEIIVAHGVPPYRLGIAETGSLGGSTAEESTKIYKDSVLQPDKTKIEFIWDGVIFEGALQIEGWSWDLNELDTTEEEQDIKLVETLWPRGAITPNETIRVLGSRFGLKETTGVPEMDYHYINNEPVETGEVLIGQAIKSVRNFYGMMEVIKDGAGNGMDGSQPGGDYDDYFIGGRRPTLSG